MTVFLTYYALYYVEKVGRYQATSAKELEELAAGFSFLYEDNEVVYLNESCDDSNEDEDHLEKE